MPAGRDVSVSHLIPYRTDFYSHARKGRDKFAEISGNQFRDLYSHTHMGHDQYFLAVQTASVISTHTPARGVTIGTIENTYLKTTISTHTPARGVTGVGEKETGRNENFYSHAREGRDVGRREIPSISTHFYSTPARGVTVI